MAKIAILFVLFALIAVCLASRIPRDAPAEPIDFKLPSFEELSNQIKSLVDQGKDTLEKVFDKDTQEKFRSAAEKFGADGKALFDDISEKLKNANEKH